MWPYHFTNYTFLNFILDMHSSAQRTSVGGMPEELTLDYTEISSIHPLPLWALLATDHEISDQFPQGFKVAREVRN